MSNFWLDDNAFRTDNSQGTEGQFTDDLFEDLPPQNANQNIQQEEPQLDTMFNDQDFSQFGGALSQKQTPQTAFAGKSPSMFMRQAENVNQFHSQSPHMQNVSPQIPHTQPQQQPQQNQQQQNQQQQNQQSILDQSKQEQLMKMRQQIMHQQMLQRQQQQGQIDSRQMQQQMPASTPKYSSGHTENLGNISQSPAKVPQQTYSNVNNTGMSPQVVNSPSVNSQLGARPKAMSMESTPRSINTGNDTAPGQQGLGLKPTPAQIAQLQLELFQMSLGDFMNRRGTPITQAPVVNNKKINLFALDILGRKIGGPQAILRHIQMLSQSPPQITEWSTVCQRLGLFEGIDAQNNVSARLQIEKQLGSCYLSYILPYEQYLSTEEGQKDISARRLQFQRQLITRLQQQQPRNAPTPQQELTQQNQQNPRQQQVAQNSGQQTSQFEHQQRTQQQWQQQQQQQQARGQLAKARAQPSDVNGGPTQTQSQFRSPSIPSQSPHHGVVPTPQAVGIPSPSASVVNSQRKLSQHSTANNTPPPSIQSPHLQQIPKQRSNSVQRRQSSVGGHSLSQKPETPQQSSIQESNGHDAGKPNTIKKYVPIKKKSSSYGDWILKSVSDLGDEIELTKPVYLFAPELGSLNIHALVMSLRNYTRNDPGEASSALNTLLVTTTDPSFAFNLTDAPELLDALVGMGLKVLDQITEPDMPTSDNDSLDQPSNNKIDSIFNNYVNKNDLKGEDIVYVVDSLTGELIEDDESDIEIDDIFSPKPISEREDDTTSSSADITQCNLPDFMSALHDFKAENKYHFSKAQTKGALDHSIFLVDNLITITMTLRNLSFTEQSSRCMSGNANFKKLVFKIVKQVATRPEIFVLQRKRLCLLKDCLLMLDRNAYFLEIDSLEEAFMTFLLVSSFGPSLGEVGDGMNSNFKIPFASLETYSYLPFSVDVFTKLFVREPKNRAFFQAVLSGSLNISSSHLNSSVLMINPQDHHEVKTLMKFHLGDEVGVARSGILLTRTFKLLLSCIPFSMTGAEYAKFVLQRSSTVLQALFGAKLLIDSIISEDPNAPFNMLLCHWLTSNVQLLLFNFIRNTVSVITESVKFEVNSGEHRVLSYVALKSMILVNSLLSNAVVLKSAHEENELENPKELELCVEELQNLYRAKPEAEFVLNTLIAPTVDQDVASEVLRFRYLIDRVGKGSARRR